MEILELANPLVEMLSHRLLIICWHGSMLSYNQHACSIMHPITHLAPNKRGVLEKGSAAWNGGFAIGR